MTDDAAIASPKAISAVGQLKPLGTAVDNLQQVETRLLSTRKRDDFVNEIRFGEITTGGIDQATKGSTALIRRSISRRSFGLNMIVSLGGLHSARGLNDRLWAAPSLRNSPLRLSFNNHPFFRKNGGAYGATKTKPAPAK